MSGHSKWSTIKRKKGAADARRSKKSFAKLLRAVEVAAREGGSVEGNMTLASAVEKARDASVPTDNIDRAIKRGPVSSREAPGTRNSYEGHGGVALFVETLTDNRNRTSQDVRHAFTRNGGNLGESGSTAWMFSRKGSIQLEKSAAPDEERCSRPRSKQAAEGPNDAESTWEIDGPRRSRPSATRSRRPGS